MARNRPEWMHGLATREAGLDSIRALVQLLARHYVARVFFLAGYSKLSDWDTTRYLFTDEYHVPLLPPLLAAMLGTLSELLFSSTLALGLYSRFSALALFLVNLTAVIAYYPSLITSAASIHDHIEWGLILALIAAMRPGSLGLEALWRLRTAG